MDLGDFFPGDAALGEGDLGFGDFLAGDAALGEEDLDLGEFFPGEAALGEVDLDFGDFFAEVGVLGEALLPLGDFLRSSLSNSFSKPMTDARLRSDSLGFKRDKLLLGVAPLRNGESGGSRLSNNSGLRKPPKETRFFFIFGAGRSAPSSPLLRFLATSFVAFSELLGDGLGEGLVLGEAIACLSCCLVAAGLAGVPSLLLRLTGDLGV